MEPQISDELIAASVQQGAKDDYQELVGRYSSKLLRYAQYLTKDADLAADVVQNTLIKAYINIQGFNLRRKFSSWIYRIAHNEAMNELKKHTRRVDADISEMALPADGAKLDELLDAKWQQQRLIQAVGNLPIKYREPLALYYFEGYSYQEISDMLRLPVSTVGVHINRAKQKLKKSISQGEANEKTQ